MRECLSGRGNEADGKCQKFIFDVTDRTEIALIGG